MSTHPFAKTFSQYLNSSPNHHIKLFQMLDQVIKEDSSLSYSFCLEIVHYILSNMEAEFTERRGIALFRFLLTNFSCQKKISQEKGFPIIKYLLHKVSFPFQKKQVLGFLVQLQGIYSEIESLQQSFQTRHQGILLIEHTTLPFIQWKKNYTFLYFEIQKKEGDFSSNEIGFLLNSLEEIALSLTSRCGNPIPSLESSFKMLRYLMNEIKEGDIPHAFIDLFEQASDKLSFFVLLSEAKGPSHCVSFSALLAHPHIEEKMRLKETRKEGIVLKIDITRSPALSLVEERKKITNLIQRCLGEFRDVNGGLLEKIEQNFHILSQVVPRPNSLLRNFFDSILPEESRATFTPSILREIYLATQKAIQDNDGDSYRLIDQDKWITAVIKVDARFRKEWEKILVKSLPKVSFSHVIDLDKVILSAFLFISSDVQKSTFIKKTKDTSTQVLKLCTTSHFTSFDPRTGTEEETSYLHKMLFEGLMRIGKTGKPELAIAERVVISSDGKTYRFFLRKSQWSNGMPLTAHDFLYSWKMVLARKDLAPLNYC